VTHGIELAQRAVTGARSSVGYATARRRPGSDSVLLPTACAITSVSVLLIAAAYAAARSRAGWAPYLYWVGELLLFLTAVVLVLAKRNSSAAATCAVLMFSIGQYLVKICYSPLRLKFPDELQHENTARGMLETGHLFPPNYGLPISPVYPGLEAAAVGLVNVLGISPYFSELLVAGIAHTLVAAAALALFRRVIKRPDLAALAALVYCFGPYQAFYNSMFVYQALALPMGILIVTQTIAILQGDRRAGRLITTLGLSACVVVTHHVTAVFVSAVLVVLAVFAACHPRYRSAAHWIVAPAVASIAMLVAWIGLVASLTLTYLGEPLAGLLSNFSRGVSNLAAPVTRQPFIESVFTYAVVVVPLVLLGILTLVSLRQRRMAVAALAGSAAGLQLAVIGIRFATADGQELAGRAQNFLSLYTAIALGICLGFRGLRPRLRRYAARTTVAILLVLFVGGITSGWPPNYERLPGTYRIAAFESSIDSHAVTAADWGRTHLPAGGRFAGDIGNLTAMGTIGHQFPNRGSYSSIFYRSSFDARDAAVVQSEAIEFLLVDMRLSSSYPPSDSHSFYGNDAPTGPQQALVAVSALQKFRRVSRVSCLYDDGTIQIYDLRGSLYHDAIH